uniref:Uncharacterized protein n=1 Tax=Arundo donax TaxID=35708 RepID=A0A0A9H558_ARUDO
MDPEVSERAQRLHRKLSEPGARNYLQGLQRRELLYPRRKVSSSVVIDA